MAHPTVVEMVIAHQVVSPLMCWEESMGERRVTHVEATCGLSEWWWWWWWWVEWEVSVVKFLDPQQSHTVPCLVDGEIVHATQHHREKSVVGWWERSEQVVAARREGLPLGDGYATR